MAVVKIERLQAMQDWDLRLGKQVSGQSRPAVPKLWFTILWGGGGHISDSLHIRYLYYYS
jgi:hypothetical protein